LWPQVQGKTALYFRPAQVQALNVQKTFRLAGKLDASRRSLKLPWNRAWQGWVVAGQSAMFSAASGQVRPVPGRVKKAGLKSGLLVLASRPLPGQGLATLEVLVSRPAKMAVPVEALEVEGERIFA
jgi:hypothetical protein